MQNDMNTFDESTNDCNQYLFSEVSVNRYNETDMCKYMSSRYNAKKLTLFEGVFEVEFGFKMLHTGGTVRIYSYSQ